MLGSRDLIHLFLSQESPQDHDNNPTGGGTWRWVFNRHSKNYCDGKYLFFDENDNCVVELERDKGVKAKSPTRTPYVWDVR